MIGSLLSLVENFDQAVIVLLGFIIVSGIQIYSHMVVKRKTEKIEENDLAHVQAALHETNQTLQRIEDKLGKLGSIKEDLAYIKARINGRRN